MADSFCPQENPQIDVNYRFDEAEGKKKYKMAGSKLKLLSFVKLALT